MKKSDREKIFNKYGGKCAYCGCELVKGWHVDEIEPVMRKKIFIQGHFAKISKAKEMTFGKKWVEGKWTTCGCEYPERFHIDNQNPACASCNINKHSGSLEDFRLLIAGFMKHLNEISTQYKIAKRYGLVSESPIEVKFYFEKIREGIF